MDLDALAQELPFLIPRNEVPKLLPGLYTAKYLANLDSLGLGPPFIKIGRKVVYLRDSFIAWLKLKVTSCEENSG